MATIMVNGVLRTDLVLANKVKVDMQPEIDLLDDQPNIFELITRQVKKVYTAENTLAEWIEQRLSPAIMVVTGVDAPGTTITVDNPGYAHRNQRIYNTVTKEWYLMNEDIGGTTTPGKITVVNQQAGTGNFVTATAVGQILWIGPETHAEGAAIPPSYAAQPTHLFTYIFQSDRTRQNTDMQRYQGEYGLNQMLIDRKTFWIEYCRAVNMDLYFSDQTREVASDSTGARRHAMNGMINQISTNFINYDAVPGNLTLPSIGELMRRCTAHTSSSQVKIGIGGQNAIEAISAMPVNAIRTTVNETEWGKNLKTIVTPFKNLNFAYDQMLSADYGTADIMVVLDPNHIQRCQIRGLERHMLLNVENNNDIHNQIDVITGTDGLMVKLEENHAWAYNIH